MNSMQASLASLPAGSMHDRCRYFEAADQRESTGWSLSPFVYKNTSRAAILVLDAQTWCDHHGITVNVQEKFGGALNDVSKQHMI
jgi:hypothetical protein